MVTGPAVESESRENSMKPVGLPIALYLPPARAMSCEFCSKAAISASSM